MATTPVNNPTNAKPDPRAPLPFIRSASGKAEVSVKPEAKDVFNNGKDYSDEGALLLTGDPAPRFQPALNVMHGIINSPTRLEIEALTKIDETSQTQTRFLESAVVMDVDAKLIISTMDQMKKGIFRESHYPTMLDYMKSPHYKKLRETRIITERLVGIAQQTRLRESTTVAGVRLNPRLVAVFNRIDKSILAGLEKSGFLKEAKRLKESLGVQMREQTDGFLTEQPNWDGGTTGALNNGREPDFIPLIAGPYNKQLYWFDYLDMHSKAFEAVTHNPVAKRIIKVITQFVLGKGVKLTVMRAVRDSDAAQAKQDTDQLAAKVAQQGGQQLSGHTPGQQPNMITVPDYKIQSQAKLDLHWTKNALHIRSKQILKDLVTFGEQFVRYFDAPWGLKVRQIDPSTVWEIITDPDDCENEFYLHQQYPCVHGDTEIPLLDGTNKTIREMAEDWKHTKQPVWIYTYDRERRTLVPGKAWNIIKVGDKKCVEVTLDNGKSFIVSEDHPVLLRDGEYKEAARLSVGESLMPLYRRKRTIQGHRSKKSSGVYEQVYQPELDCWEFTHRRVCKEIWGLEYGKVAASNTGPAMEAMKKYFKEHGYEERTERTRQLHENPEWRKRFCEAVSRGKLSKSCNHKVVSIRKVGWHEVYDVTVDIPHQSLVQNGKEVHNPIGLVAGCFLGNTRYQWYVDLPVPTIKFIIRQVPSLQYYHMKINATAGEVRGRSELFAILGWLKRLKEWASDRVVRNKVSNLFVLDVAVEGDQNAVQQITQQFSNPPTPGSFFIHNKAAELKAIAAELGASDAQNDWTVFLTLAAMGAGVSLQYLGAESQGGKAQALVGTEPDIKSFEDYQEFMEQFFLQDAQRVFERAKERNELPKDLRITVEATFPTLAEENRSEKLKDLAFCESMSWFSHRRVANAVAKELQMTSYNYDQEQKEVAQEDAMKEFLINTAYQQVVKGVDNSRSALAQMGGGGGMGTGKGMSGMGMGKLPGAGSSGGGGGAKGARASAGESEETSLIDGRKALHETEWLEEGEGEDDSDEGLSTTAPGTSTATHVSGLATPHNASTGKRRLPWEGADVDGATGRKDHYRGQDPRDVSASIQREAANLRYERRAIGRRADRTQTPEKVRDQKSFRSEVLDDARQARRSGNLGHESLKTIRRFPRLAEAGVKGMKWGEHHVSSLDPTGKGAKWDTKNKGMTTPKYPVASSVLDFMMEKGNGHSEGNFSYMNGEDYKHLTGKVQDYLEKHEGLIKQAEGTLQQLNRSDVRALMYAIADNGGQYAKSIADEIKEKRGVDPVPILKLAAGVKDVYRSLQYSDHIHPMVNDPGVSRTKDKSDLADYIQKKYPSDYSRQILAHSYFKTKSKKESMEPFKPQDGDQLQKPRVLPVEEHFGTPRSSGKMRPRGFANRKRED